MIKMPMLSCSAPIAVESVKFKYEKLLNTVIIISSLFDLHIMFLNFFLLFACELEAAGMAFVEICSKIVFVTLEIF